MNRTSPHNPIFLCLQLYQHTRRTCNRSRVGSSSELQRLQTAVHQWENFIGNCTGCTIDVIPIHWYDSATNIAYFQSYISSAYAVGGNRPLWITEFGASGTDSQIQSFFDTVLPWLDGLSYIQRYAYFYDGPSTSSITYLVNEAGTAMSDIGTVFNGL